MRKLKVAFVVPSFYPMIGGVEIYALNIARELRSHGHEIHVFTPDSVLGERLRPSNEIVDGISVHRIKTLFDLSYRLKLWPSLKREIQITSPDIVHVYSQDLYSWLALSASRELKIPILLTTYGPFRGQGENSKISAALLSFYDSWISTRILRNVTGVNMRYPELLQWLSLMGILNNAISLEPSCISSSYLNEAKGDAVREEFGIDSKILLFIGRLSRQKGIHHLVRAAKIVHDREQAVELIIMGPKYPDLDLSDLPPWIHVLPPTLSAQREMELIAASDLFVMPSRFEGFSQAVLKAIAQGKTVIASDVGGLPFELGYGKFGRLVPFGNDDALAEMILRCLDHPPDFNKEAMKRHASGFTYEKNSNRLESQYLRLVEIPQ